MDGDIDMTERTAELENDIQEAIGTLMEVHGYSEEDIDNIVKQAKEQ